jgi:hypothetical protein
MKLLKFTIVLVFVFFVLSQTFTEEEEIEGGSAGEAAVEFARSQSGKKYTQDKW